MMFAKLPSNSRTLLFDIVSSDDPVNLLQERFEKCVTDKQDDELRSLIRELRENGYIKVQWADDVPCYVEISNSARTYSERELEFERQLLSASGSTTNHFHGSATNVQIQQNTNNSSQTINVDSEIDYDKAAEIFKTIIANMPSFNLPTGSERELVNIATEVMPMVEARTNTPSVKKALALVKDILLRTTSSLAASGVLYMISQIGG